MSSHTFTIVYWTVFATMLAVQIGFAFDRAPGSNRRWRMLVVGTDLALTGISAVGGHWLLAALWAGFAAFDVWRWRRRAARMRAGAR